MAKIKMTKNEWKNQKDALKMYNRYLPTLILKKQQLQSEIKFAEDELKKSKQVYADVLKQFESWVSVFGQNIELDQPLFTLTSLEIEKGNIAGVEIPILKKAKFDFSSYDLFTTPLWVDKAVTLMQQAMEFDIKTKIAEKKVSLLQKELTTTTQRVNIFEKVKIPETKEVIKKISIYLGDMQTAAVVRGKISKNKTSAQGGSDDN